MKLHDALKLYRGLWVSSHTLPIKYRLAGEGDVPQAMCSDGQVYSYGAVHLDDLEDDLWDLDRVMRDDIPMSETHLLDEVLAALARGRRVWVDSWPGYLHRPHTTTYWYDNDGAQCAEESLVSDALLGLLNSCYPQEYFVEIANTDLLLEGAPPRLVYPKVPFKNFPPAQDKEAESLERVKKEVRNKRVRAARAAKHAEGAKRVKAYKK